jgi:hypothetical protein
MTGPRRWMGVALTAACGAAPLGAQGPALWAGATVVGVHAQGDGSLGGRTAGTVLGGLVTAQLGAFDVEGRYLQGALQPQDDMSPRRELVQGQLVLGYHATPWLSAHTGARARAYITPTGTERWLVWLLGARVESPIVGTTVRGHVALWRALALSANVGSDVGRAGRGGEAGVTLQLPSRPVWFRLAYGIDQSAVRGAARRETVEEFTLSVGVHKP